MLQGAQVSNPWNPGQQINEARAPSDNRLLHPIMSLNLRERDHQQTLSTSHSQPLATATGSSAPDMPAQQADDADALLAGGVPDRLDYMSITNPSQGSLDFLQDPFTKAMLSADSMQHMMDSFQAGVAGQGQSESQSQRLPTSLSERISWLFKGKGSGSGSGSGTEAVATGK